MSGVEEDYGECFSVEVSHAVGQGVGGVAVAADEVAWGDLFAGDSGGQAGQGSEVGEFVFAESVQLAEFLGVGAEQLAEASVVQY